MDQVITVKDNKRHTKRKMYDALGNDLVKILTELITNSDDSYRRLKNGQDKKQISSEPIFVNVYKREKRVEVIDNAEGMSEEDVIKNFQSYGADKSGREEGHKTRGLFGQGASDVLFTQEHGKIISIKNESALSAEFYWEGDERRVSIKNNLPILEIRKKFNISGNGTVVSFVLNEKTKVQNNLLGKLSQFYMLRYVMNDKRRAIYLKQFSDDKNFKETRLHYEFPPINNGDELFNKDLSFNYEGKEIIATLIINKISNKNEKLDKYGELRLLVHDDENNVYDNTFFSLGEKYPGMECIFGYLKLNGTADIIREKLNLEIPEEILTDSRDGLNKRHEFYKTLSAKIEPTLEFIANKMSKGGKELIKSEDFKEHKKMFQELNKYLNEELDEVNDTGNSVGAKPPADGFDFIRDRIKITVGKKYSLKFLVNPAIIASGTEITFEIDNDESVLVSPLSIIVDYEKDVEEIIFLSLVVEGIKVTDKDCCLTAKVHNGNIEKKVFISVVNEEIYYPRYGMEFKPSYLSTKVDHDAKLHLYVDMNKYPLGSEIKFISSNQKIELAETKIVLNESCVLFENIALVEVVFRSKLNNTTGKIIANCKNYLAEADVEIIDSVETNHGKSGLISGWKFIDSPEAEWQKYLHPKNGKIIINSGNKVNKYYFGDDLSQTRLLETNKLSQRYLAELISDEVAKFMVKKQIDKGQLGREYEEAIEEHQRRKNKVAGIVYKFIVT